MPLVRPVARGVDRRFRVVGSKLFSSRASSGNGRASRNPSCSSGLYPVHPAHPVRDEDPGIPPPVIALQSAQHSPGHARACPSRPAAGWQEIQDRAATFGAARPDAPRSPGPPFDRASRGRNRGAPPPPVASRGAGLAKDDGSAWCPPAPTPCRRPLRVDGPPPRRRPSRAAPSSPQHVTTSRSCSEATAKHIPTARPQPTRGLRAPK